MKYQLYVRSYGLGENARTLDELGINVLDYRDLTYTYENFGEALTMLNRIKKIWMHAMLRKNVDMVEEIRIVPAV